MEEGGMPSPVPVPVLEAVGNGESQQAVAGETREEKPRQDGEMAAAAVLVENGESHKAVAEDRKQENPLQGGAVAATMPAAMAVVEPAAAVGMKKKRGRPRKYGPDGSLVVRPLKPKPLSASAPVGEYTPAAAVGAMLTLGGDRPVGIGPGKPSQHGFGLESVGEMVACSAGANFTPHVLTVAAGEDVTMKIISFSQLGPRAICILSANGSISNATLRQPDSFGGTLTYEGLFQLLSLSGSFIPMENGGTRSRTGGMSVALASPDGRVVGGGVAGLLLAAGPVRVVVGSFLPSYQLEQKAKKTKLETAPLSTPMAAVPTSCTEMQAASCDGQTRGGSSTTSKKILTTSSSFRLENWAAPLQSVPDMRNSVLV